ncbi:MAG: MFS transporter [Actinomycetota bacterium]
MSADDTARGTADDTTSGGSLGRGYRRLFAASTISNLGDGIGMLAYPWLASAITRNPLLISIVVVLQRLPWLLVSLPAGVVADRYDRATIMVRANLGRAAVTLVVAGLVLSRQDDLPAPDDLQTGDAAAAAAGAAAGGGTDVALYAVLLVAIFLLGVGEVLYDNAAQSFLPRLVPPERLERANGRLWSAEQTANFFVGPPLGAWLLVVLFALPFLVDATTFAVSAALIAAIVPLRGLALDRQASGQATSGGPTAGGWRREMAEGFRWLWRHRLLRTLAIVLGVLNGLGALGMASLVLFAQEELGTSPGEFALLNVGAAVGAVAGGWAAPTISARIGPGPSLWLTLLAGGVSSIVIGSLSSWPFVAVLFGLSAMLGMLWNVITVSLRQTIIPDELLGRVNSVYRFFGWGMMPIGALLGGVTMAVVEAVSDRSMALRAPWLLAGVGQLVLLAAVGSQLTTARIEAARAGTDRPVSEA